MFCYPYLAISCFLFYLKKGYSLGDQQICFFLHQEADFTQRYIWIECRLDFGAYNRFYSDFECFGDR